MIIRSRRSRLVFAEKAADRKYLDKGPARDHFVKIYEKDLHEAQKLKMAPSKYMDMVQRKEGSDIRLTSYGATTLPLPQNPRADWPFPSADRPLDTSKIMQTNLCQEIVMPTIDRRVSPNDILNLIKARSGVKAEAKMPEYKAQRKVTSIKELMEKFSPDRDDNPCTGASL